MTNKSNFARRSIARSNCSVSRCACMCSHCLLIMELVLASCLGKQFLLLLLHHCLRRGLFPPRPRSHSKNHCNCEAGKKQPTQTRSSLEWSEFVHRLHDGHNWHLRACPPQCALAPSVRACRSGFFPPACAPLADCAALHYSCHALCQGLFEGGMGEKVVQQRGFVVDIQCAGRSG